jgi:hypothetical protein
MLAAGRLLVYARPYLPKTFFAEIGTQPSSALEASSVFSPALSSGERKTEIWNNLDHSKIFPKRNGTEDKNGIFYKDV